MRKNSKEKPKCSNLCLVQRKGRRELSEGKRTKSEATMGSVRVSCIGENYEYHNGIDCSVQNTSVNNGIYPTKNDCRRKCREDNSKRTPHPYPYLRRYCHVSTTRMLGENPVTVTQGNNHSSVEEDTVKRRRDKVVGLLYSRFSSEYL